VNLDVDESVAVFALEKQFNDLPWVLARDLRRAFPHDSG